MDSPLKRTPLHEIHRRLGARLIPFGGWEMPVQYSSIVDEHLCVRRAAGIFDISHMGEFKVRGPGAEAFLNATLTNDVRRLETGAGQYSQMCHERGGTVDDLYVYRVAAAEYLLIVNASRSDVDLAWLRQRRELWKGAGLELEDCRESLGAVAVQGPRVAAFVDALFPGESLAGVPVDRVTGLEKNGIGLWRCEGRDVWVARTGYTGEDGFEIVAPRDMLPLLWDRVMAAGHAACVQPCGLGARDTLRTEVCYPLYGHELDEETSPIEAGLGVFVSFEKGDFVGREALLEQKTRGPSRRCVAFRMTGKSAPPRPGYPVWHGGHAVGRVVSGTQSPSLGVGIGLAYVPPELAAPQTGIEIEIRGQRFAAETARKPLYRRP